MAIEYIDYLPIPAAVVDFHHEVLIPWSRWRRELFPGSPFEVVTFDHHTDVLPSAVTPASGDWQSPEKTLSAVEKLRHDEHLDWR